MVDDAVHLLGISAAAIYLRSSDAREARWACDAGDCHGERAVIRRLCVPVEVDTGQAAALWDTLAPPGSSLHVLVAVPMIGHDAAERGLLCLFDGAARDLSSCDTALIQGLADRAASTIENAALVQQIDEIEARHHFLLDRLPDVIWAAGADRVFTYVSAGSEGLLGYRPDELVGRSSDIVMHESSREAFQEGYHWQMAHPDGDQTYRVNLRHKDGHPVPIELHNIGTPIDGKYGGGTGTVREMAERDRLEREIRTQAAELASTRERAHLAQELHDSVTQALFSMTITAGAARMLLERNKSGAEEKLDELSALARDALSEMHGLIFELRPGTLAEEGLVPSLRRHVAAVQGRTGLAIRLDIAPDLKRLAPPTEDALYRIAQEAVHNIVKHAHAQEITMRIASPSNVVRMQVRDDGVGFDPHTPNDGLGLAGMAARAERLDGSVTVESTPRRGTCVTAVLPIAIADPLPSSDRR